MPLFGGGNKKVKFDASEPPQELARNPRSYSFVHNFKVHYKKSSLQLLAEKIDISVTSKYPQLPPPHWVTDRFNRRRHYGSFHITNVEYKESFAFRIGNSSKDTLPEVPVIESHATGSLNTTVSSKFCTKCGTKLPLSSRFCNSCGASQP